MTQEQSPATYTVLEAAEAAHITKNTAKYRLRNAPQPFTFMGADGKIQVTEQGVQWLIESVLNQKEPPKPRTRTTAPEKGEPEEPAKTTVKTSLEPDEPGADERTRTTAPDIVQLMQSVITDLRNQVAQSEQQIAAKDSQLAKAQAQLDIAQAQLSRSQEQLSTALDQLSLAQTQLSQAQQLHAGTIQQGLLEAKEPQPEPDSPATDTPLAKPGLWERIIQAFTK